MRFTTKLASVAVALVASASVAAAQATFTYSTSGAFSGTGCTSESCVFGNFTLSYTGQQSASYFSPSNVFLGNFVTLASGTTAPTTPIGSNAQFTLTVTQTSPSTGSNNIIGTVTGSLSYNPSQSSLAFNPTQSSFAIGAVNYRLITDNNGAISIAAPTASTGGNPNQTTIKASVFVTPEPSSYAMLATGLVGTLAAMRRRRSA